MPRQYKNSKSGAYSSLEKSLSKLPAKTLVLIVLWFVLGAAIAFSTLFLVCKDDKFVVNGQKNITITIGSTYTDDGVTIRSFRKDISNQVDIKVYDQDGKLLDKGLSAIDTSAAGEYKIVYSVSNIRYKNVELIRTLTIAQEEAPEVDAA